MKILLVSLIPLCIFFSSCSKKNKEMEIRIKNDFNNELSVELFPKSEYALYNHLYKPSDIRSGYRKREFDILPKEYKGLFGSKKLDQMPYDLVDRIFDSIFIYINETTLKFSREKVIGYSENLFTDDSNWEFEIIDYDISTMKSTWVETHTFSFIITEAKLKQ